jgi:hypothetical protein
MKFWKTCKNEKNIMEISREVVSSGIGQNFPVGMSDDVVYD